jgi:hypothetical protein
MADALTATQVVRLMLRRAPDAADRGGPEAPELVSESASTIAPEAPSLAVAEPRPVPLGWWPEELPGLGRAHSGPYTPCADCPPTAPIRGTFRRYGAEPHAITTGCIYRGGTPLCRAHAVARFRAGGSR